MKLGVLFSGGKDSVYALHKAVQEHEISCLLAIDSENPHSYMFHTPNIKLTQLQAEALGIPLLLKRTKGVKEVELEDLKELIKSAVDKYQIEGVVTGALASVYQATRVQKICAELGLWCFNPLWQMDQVELLHELLENKFEVMIVGVFGYPLDETWLGKTIDVEMVDKLVALQTKYKLNPAGEGGELETFVTYTPLFKKRLVVKKAKVEYGNYAGTYLIDEAELVDIGESINVSEVDEE